MDKKFIMAFKDDKTDNFIVFELKKDCCEAFATARFEDMFAYNDVKEKLGGDFNLSSLFVIGLTNSSNSIPNNSCWSYHENVNLYNLFVYENDEFWEIVEKTFEFFFEMIYS